MTQGKTVQFGSESLEREEVIYRLDIAIQNQAHIHEGLTTLVIQAQQIRKRYLTLESKIGTGWLARLFMGTTKRMEKLLAWKTTFDDLMLLASERMQASDYTNTILLRNQFIGDYIPEITENTAARIRMWQEFRQEEVNNSLFFRRLEELSRELNKI